MKSNVVTVIGGDQRNKYLSSLLIKESKEVHTIGLEGNLEGINLEKVSKILSNSDIVIGPIPVSIDGININMPLSDNKLSLEFIISNMKKDAIFFGGLIKENNIDLFNKYRITYFDILKREEMTVMNAIPTSEGAIQIAMEETKKTIHESKALVIGFGRIGKTLASMLKALGAKITVTARKYSDLSWINVLGYESFKTKDLEEAVQNMDLIFNTVPVQVINSHILKKVDKDCIIIDLASKPGGVDFKAADELGIKTIWALSLPGKVAPLSAAEIIMKTIFNVLDEWR